MERLEVSGAIRPIYGSLGVKRLTSLIMEHGVWGATQNWCPPLPGNKSFYSSVFYLSHIIELLKATLMFTRDPPCMTHTQHQRCATIYLASSCVEGTYFRPTHYYV